MAETVIHTGRYYTLKPFFFISKNYIKKILATYVFKWITLHTVEKINECFVSPQANLTGLPNAKVSSPTHALLALQAMQNLNMANTKYG